MARHYVNFTNKLSEYLEEIGAKRTKFKERAFSEFELDSKNFGKIIITIPFFQRLCYLVFFKFEKEYDLPLFNKENNECNFLSDSTRYYRAIDDIKKWITENNIIN